MAQLGHIPWNKGQRKAQTTRYRARTVRGHPKATGPKHAVYEHVVIAEAALGKYLPDGAVVHHVDGDKANNAPSNLVICQDQTYHLALHMRARIQAAGGDPFADRICCACKGVLPLRDFQPVHAGSKARRPSSRCRTCTRDWEHSYADVRNLRRRKQVINEQFTPAV